MDEILQRLRGTVTDAGLLLHKIERVRAQADVVDERRPASADVLASDHLLRDALALALIVAVQEAIDIAYHLCAGEAWGVPDSHASAFDLLAEHGVVPRETADLLVGMARLPNRIAHGYASVDHARVWEELPDGIAALRRYAQDVATWLPDDPTP